jgi:hypothetical protein
MPEQPRGEQLLLLASVGLLLEHLISIVFFFRTISAPKRNLEDRDDSNLKQLRLTLTNHESRSLLKAWPVYIRSVPPCSYIFFSLLGQP